MPSTADSREVAGRSPPARSAPGFLGTWVATAATLAAIATVVTSSIAGPPLEDRLAFGVAVAELAAVVLLVMAAWLVAGDHPRVAVGLAVTAIALLGPLWAARLQSPLGLRAALLAMAPLAVAGMAQVALGWPRDAGPWPALRIVYLLAASAALVHLLAFNPFAEPGCATVCTDVRPVGAGVLDARSAFAVVTVLTLAAAVAATSAVLGARAPRAPRLVSGAVLVAIWAITAPFVARWLKWGELRLPPMLLALPAATALVGAAVNLVIVRARRARAAVAKLVAQLSDPGNAVGDIRRVAGAVQYAVPDEGRWVDATGHTAAGAGEGDRYVVVGGPAGPVLRFPVADGGYGDEVADALTPAMRLSLMNAQLAAVTRARLAEVQASRRRIVATADTERRRIERDLHDGAQQRLVGATFYLNVAGGRLGEAGPGVVEAKALVLDALGHLRRLAHGLFPGVLATEGLWGALDELARTSSAAVVLEVDGDDDVSPETAMAAYSLVAAATAHGEQEGVVGAILVSARRSDTVLEISVQLGHGDAPAEPVELVDAMDRIEAAGGDLEVSLAPDSTTWKAVIPCGS